MKEDFAWVLKCIDSSFTDFHFEACQTLIKLFGDKYTPPVQEIWALNNVLSRKKEAQQ
jgi:hypothetical protein